MDGRPGRRAARVAPRPVWSLPPAWRLLLGGWALILSLAWPIVVARELAFDWHTLGDEAAINSWAMLTAARVVAWALYVVQTQLLACCGSTGCGAGSPAEPWRRRRPFHALWVGVTVASAVAIYQGAMDLRFLSTTFWANERRAAGTLLDANGYGMLAALAAPVAAWWLRARPAAALAVFAVNAVGLWMSGSRTALRRARRRAQLASRAGARVLAETPGVGARRGVATALVAGAAARGRARDGGRRGRARCGASPRCRSRARASRICGAAAATARSPCR